MSNDTLDAASERPREHRENRKKNRGRQVGDNQARAIAKFIRVPPRKARLVMNEVRGKYVFDALAFLRFIPNRAAGFISKALASAVANAANNHKLDPERLRLVEARVDEGPRMKRVQPRAQGRAYRILKRMSHITVIVEEVEPKPRKPRKVVVTGKRAQAAREARQPQIQAQPVEVEQTNPATVATEAVTPVSHAADEHVDQGPQSANKTETTDEIGAPEPPLGDAPAPHTEAAKPSSTGNQGAQSANDDKTDEIGAPIDRNAAAE